MMKTGGVAVGWVVVAASRSPPSPAPGPGGRPPYTWPRQPGLLKHRPRHLRQAVLRDPAAAKKVTAGDTVQVRAGTYPEGDGALVGHGHGRITFTAAPARASRSAAASTASPVGQSWVTINGSTSSTPPATAWPSIGRPTSRSRTTTSASGQPASGFTKYGIRLNAVTDSVVSHNTVDHNTNAGIGLVSNPPTT
jgi:hypothetical protein